MTKAESFFLEAVQFVPVITLASSFIVTGGVDLNRATTLFVISGIGAAVITIALAAKKVLLNPILLGTNLWLCIGATAFGIPIAPLATLLGGAQAFGLFACVAAVAVPLLILTSTGFIGLRHPDPKVVRKLSLMLLGATALILFWSFMLRDNIRLGGGLPFIVLNVTRRMLIRRNKP